MRQADSTIKGYLYQFNKSIFEILSSSDNETITLEGTIEDIDIDSLNNCTTIQCKYHEDKKFQISNVAEPILEMLCHYQKSITLNKNISYVLYAHYAENEDSIDKDIFKNYITATKSKDIILGYYHQIYTIPDQTILDTALKPRKTNSDKKTLLDYYSAKRDSLKLCVDIDAFWRKFKYQKAEQFDTLRDQIIAKFSEVTDAETAKTLYYPNAFSRISYMSSQSDINQRRITKKDLLSFLASQTSVLVTKWTLAALGKNEILKKKKATLIEYFRNNPDVRAFILGKKYVEDNQTMILPFIQAYIEKYYKKPRLQKPPIFIFENCPDIMNNIIIGLYQYQKYVNCGVVGQKFIDESFVNNQGCSNSISCKMTSLDNVTVALLEKCNVNQLFIIGPISVDLESDKYYSERIDILSLNELKYLVGLSTTLEE